MSVYLLLSQALALPHIMQGGLDAIPGTILGQDSFQGREVQLCIAGGSTQVLLVSSPLHFIWSKVNHSLYEQYISVLYKTT